MPKNNSAFTLIELLVVVSLIGLMAATIVPIFGNFNRTQILEQAAKKLKTDIRNSQNKSLSSIKAKGGILPRAWGIKISLDSQGRANSYQIIDCLRDANFGTNSFSCALSETNDFPTNIVVNSITANGSAVFSGAAINFYLVFDLLSGRAYYQSGDAGIPDEVDNNNVLIQSNYTGVSGGLVVTVGPGGMIQD